MDLSELERELRATLSLLEQREEGMGTHMWNVFLTERLSTIVAMAKKAGIK